MVAEINTDDVFALTASQTNGVKKVDPVGMSKSLPDGGKELPVKENKSDSMKENIDDTVQKLNEHVQFEQRELQFTVDEESGRTVVKVIDTQTKELIRQIPNEEAIKVAQRLSEGSNLKILDEYT